MSEVGVGAGGACLIGEDVVVDVVVVNMTLLQTSLHLSDKSFVAFSSCHQQCGFILCGSGFIYGVCEGGRRGEDEMSTQ